MVAVFKARHIPYCRLCVFVPSSADTISSTNLFAAIDADALSKLETAAIALDGDINEIGKRPVDKMIA